MQQSSPWEANRFSVQKYPTFFWNPKVHYHSHKCLPIVPILSQPRSSPHPHIPLQGTCPIQAPNIPHTKCHISFSLLMLDQSISTGPRLTLWLVSQHDKFFMMRSLLAPRPTPKLEDQTLSAVRECSFNNNRSYTPYWRPFLHPQPEDAPYRGDRDPLITDCRCQLRY